MLVVSVPKTAAGRERDTVSSIMSSNMKPVGGYRQHVIAAASDYK